MSPSAHNALYHNVHTQQMKHTQCLQQVVENLCISMQVLHTAVGKKIVDRIESEKFKKSSRE